MMQSPNRSQLKSGQRPVQKNIRAYKPGDVLFEEGDRGRELYILEEGKAGVYKNTPDGEVELAILEKGSIVGEMSLLDAMPRSATVRALEPTKALVINEVIFQAVLKKTPVWLTSIIKIIVSRLRDANRRIDQSVLRDKERGIVSLMLLLLSEQKHEFSGTVALDRDAVLVDAYYVCRLKKKESIALLEGCAKRGFIAVEEDTDHRTHICFKDLEAVRLFNEFLALKSRRKKFKEIGIPEENVTMLSNIAYVAQKSGTQTAEGTLVSRRSVEEDFDEKERERFGKSLLDLRRRGLVNLMPEGDDMNIVFSKDILGRIKKIKEWLPKFEMSV